MAQRLIADAAALAGADAMFVFVAQEAVRAAAMAGERGDAAIDGLAAGEDAVRGAAVVACLHEVSRHAVIAAVPPPAVMMRELEGEEPEPAEDAFSDLARGMLEAGADAVAVTGDDAADVGAGVARATGLAQFFSRPVLGVCLAEGAVTGWVAGGGPLRVVSTSGSWPQDCRGVVITAGDVSGRWDADRLRAVGSARP